MRTEDGYIIYKCLNGEPEAFSLLVDKYKASIYAFTYAKLRNFHDAEDVTQETFIKAYRNLRNLRRWDSFLAWLYSIASDLCKKWVRSYLRRPDHDFAEDQDAAVLKDHSINSYRDDMMYESLHEALDSLPETYQQVLMLYYLGGMKSREIARFLGTSPTAIRKRLSRARVQLRKEMIDMMGKTLKPQRLQASFTFRIAEAIKRIKIQPVQRTAGLPWGISLAAGIIIAVMSMGSHLSTFTPVKAHTFASLPSEAKVMKTGEIPVDIFKIDQIPILASKQGDGDIGDSKSLSPQKAIFMAPDGEVTFTNVTEEAGLKNMPIDAAPVWGDYDGDGDLDLYVAYSQWGWWEMGPDAFYRNNGDGTFTDITKEAGFGENKGACTNAGFLDYDNDGDLDIYVYNPTWNGAFDNHLALYRNAGDGTFIDVAEEVGIKQPIYSLKVTGMGHSLMRLLNPAWVKLITVYPLLLVITITTATWTSICQMAMVVIHMSQPCFSKTTAMALSQM